MNLSLMASRFIPRERLGTASTLHAFLEPRNKSNTPPSHQRPGGSESQHPGSSESQHPGSSESAGGGPGRIDMDVFQALPVDIQQEVLPQTHHHKDRKSSTSSPDIKRYFTTHNGRDRRVSGSRDDCAPPAKRQRGDEEEGEVCEKCQQSVPVWRVEEHRDYHFALELQREEEERQERRAVMSQSGNGKQVGKKRANSIQNFFARQ